MKMFLALLTLMSAVHAQSGQLPRAQVGRFGNGCGDQGEPAFPATIVVQGLPVFGQTMSTAYNSPVFVQYPFTRMPVLVVGLSRTASRGGVPLPFLLDRFTYQMGGFDCYALCSDEVTVTFSGHVLAYQIPIPNDRRLLGMRIYMQWYIWYQVLASQILRFWVVTDGAVLTIGY